jgi:hypothetical protein
MDTFIALPPDRQKLFYEEAQAKLKLPSMSIEKDFWVCWTLRELFAVPDWGAQLTFKGGTSLSKGWQLISRFSEDIDVVIDRDFLGYGGDDISGKKQKRLVKECSRCIKDEMLPLLQKRLRAGIPDGLSWELVLADTLEDPDQQTLLFKYPSVISGTPVYLRPVVKIELGARSETEPVEAPAIMPYLAKAFPGQLPNSSFSIRTVAARRTFWEKAMLLHEETFRPAEKARRARLSRHYYDLFCLIKAGIAQQAMDDPGLFERVARHRQIFFKQSWVDYDTLHRGLLRLVPAQERLSEWRRDYSAMLDVMFFEEPPSFDEVLAEVGRFQDAFNRIEAIHDGRSL